MNIICEIKFGSHLYGTDTENSDIDIKGVYLPDSKDILLGSYKKSVVSERSKANGERNTKDDVDKEYLSLDRFIQLLCEGQTMALDMLFAPSESYILYTWQWDKIRNHILENKTKFLSRDVAAFFGYAKKQAAKYGIKGSRMDAVQRTLTLLNTLPEQDKLGTHHDELAVLVQHTKDLVSLEKTPLVQFAITKDPSGNPLHHLEVANRKIPLDSSVKNGKQLLEKIYAEYGDRSHKAHLNGGVDFKALSHAIRVNAEAKELLSTGYITFPRPEAQLLRNIKLGTVPFDEVSEMVEQGLADMMEAKQNSMLPTKPDLEFASDIVYRTYREIVKEDETE